MLTLLFFEATNVNLLLGLMPESLGVLMFGFVLIAFAVGLRRIFRRSESKTKEENVSADTHLTVG